MKTSELDELIAISKRSLRKFKETGVVGSWSEDEKTPRELNSIEEAGLESALLRSTKLIKHKGVGE